MWRSVNDLYFHESRKHISYRHALNAHVIHSSSLTHALTHMFDLKTVTITIIITGAVTLTGDQE